MALKTMFTQEDHKTVEVYTFLDADGKTWKVEFENNQFMRTIYDLRSPYTREDWAKLAEFAQIIEELCVSKDSAYNPDNVMSVESATTPVPTESEEEQWIQLDAKHGIRPSMNQEVNI